jgi:hypothetical protein
MQKKCNLGENHQEQSDESKQNQKKSKYIRQYWKNSKKYQTLVILRRKSTHKTQSQQRRDRCTRGSSRGR